MNATTNLRATAKLIRNKLPQGALILNGAAICFIISLAMGETCHAQVILGVPAGGQAMAQNVANSPSPTAQSLLQSALISACIAALPKNLPPDHAQYHPHATRDCDLLKPHPPGEQWVFDWAGHVQALTDESLSCPICNPSPLPSQITQPIQSNAVPARPRPRQTRPPTQPIEAAPPPNLLNDIDRLHAGLGRQESPNSSTSVFRDGNTEIHTDENIPGTTVQQNGNSSVSDALDGLATAYGDDQPTSNGNGLADTAVSKTASGDASPPSTSSKTVSYIGDAASTTRDALAGTGLATVSPFGQFAQGLTLADRASTLYQVGNAFSESFESGTAKLAEEGTKTIVGTTLQPVCLQAVELGCDYGFNAGLLAEGIGAFPGCAVGAAGAGLACYAGSTVVGNHLGALVNEAVRPQIEEFEENFGREIFNINLNLQDAYGPDGYMNQ
jgi:hypothetical protein